MAVQELNIAQLPTIKAQRTTVPMFTCRRVFISEEGKLFVIITVRADYSGNYRVVKQY